MNTLGLYCFVSTNARLLASGIVPDWLVSMCTVNRQTNMGINCVLFDPRSNKGVGSKRAGQALLHQTPYHARTGFVDVADAHSPSNGPLSSPSCENRPLRLDVMARTAKTSCGAVDEEEGPALVHHPGTVFLVLVAEGCQTARNTTSPPVITDRITPLPCSSTPPLRDVIVALTAPPSVLENGTFAQLAVESALSGRPSAIPPSLPSAARVFDCIQVAAPSPLPSPTCIETVLFSATDLTSCAETTPGWSDGTLPRLKRRDAELRAAAAQGRQPVQSDQSIRRMKKRQKMITCKVTDQMVPQDQRITAGNDNSQSSITSLDQQTSPNSNRQFTMRDLRKLSDETFPSQAAPGITKWAAVVKSSIQPPSYDDGNVVPRRHEGSLAVNTSSPSVRTSDEHDTQQCVDESLSFVPQAVSRRNGKSVTTNIGSRFVTANDTAFRGAGGIGDSAEVSVSHYLPVRDLEKWEQLTTGDEHYRHMSQAIVPIPERYSHLQAPLEGPHLRERVTAVDPGWVTGPAMDRGSRKTRTGYLLLPPGFELWSAYMGANTAEDDDGAKHYTSTHKALKHDVKLCTSGIPSKSYERSVQFQFSLPMLENSWSPSSSEYTECLERPTIPGVSQCPLHGHSHHVRPSRTQRTERPFLNVNTSPQRPGAVSAPVPTSPLTNWAIDLTPRQGMPWKPRKSTGEIQPLQDMVNYI
ncbi:hypothetical protein F5I97DRAFT_1902424 [Phlebopus sp. FC_14]|nr:hypothetical protein F5I97DRAFT_1902424 [Phlebopus sp. FC_14]